MNQTMKLTKKQASEAQESRIAAALNWHKVAGSGARPLNPGDVISDEWLGECKTHTAIQKSITFRHDVWLKLCDEAKSRFKNPVLFVDDGSQQVDLTWALVSGNVGLDEDVIMLEYPYSILRNIVFNGYELASRLVIQNNPSKSIVYRANWHGEIVYVTRFHFFKRLFGDVQ